MKLVLAEKTSVAQSLARVIVADKRQDVCLEIEMERLRPFRSHSFKVKDH